MPEEHDTTLSALPEPPPELPAVIAVPLVPPSNPFARVGVGGVITEATVESGPSTPWLLPRTV